jgi:presequence protease
VDWLLSEKHEWRLVEEAILGVIGNIDKPGSPAGEAKDAFFSNLYGRTPERRRHFRQRVLGVTLADLQRVGETYLKAENASIAVISGPAAEQRCRDIGLEVKTL